MGFIPPSDEQCRLQQVCIKTDIPPQVDYTSPFTIAFYESIFNAITFDQISPANIKQVFR